MEDRELAVTRLEQLFAKDTAAEAESLMKLQPKLGQYGLRLTKENASELVCYKNESLKKHRRIEFGKSILEALVFAFSDSQYLNDDNWVETMEQLQDIFYEFKNETKDRMTDVELIQCMKEQFETVCGGDVEHLADTCLERIARKVRAGSEKHRERDGRGLYEEVDEEQRWDADLYHDALRELMWE